MFSQRAEIPAVFSLDHAPALSVPPQIHIKVSPLKETLAKYICERSVASLSCWTRGEGVSQSQPRTGDDSFEWMTRQRPLSVDKCSARDTDLGELSLTGSLPRRIVHTESWEKFPRTFSTRPGSKRQPIDSPERRGRVPLLPCVC